MSRAHSEGKGSRGYFPSILISKLEVGTSHIVDQKRPQVNRSATRYQTELACLVSDL